VYKLIYYLLLLFTTPAVGWSATGQAAPSSFGTSV